jgi:hypothetical protein
MQDIVRTKSAGYVPIDTKIKFFIQNTASPAVF